MKLRKIKPTKELRLKLKKRKHDNKIRIQQLKEIQEHQQKLMEDWEKQGTIDNKKYIKQWEETKDKVFKETLKDFVHSFAYMDGVIKASNALHLSLGLDKIELEINSIQGLIAKTLKMKTMRCLLGTGNFTEKDQESIWNLFLQKEFSNESKLVKSEGQGITRQRPQKRRDREASEESGG